MARIQLKLARSDLPGALVAIEQAEEIARAWDNQVVLRGLASDRAWAQLLMGDLEAVQRWAAAAEQDEALLRYMAEDRVVEMLVRAWIALGLPGRARALFDRRRGEAVAAGCQGHVLALASPTGALGSRSSLAGPADGARPHSVPSHELSAGAPGAADHPAGLFLQGRQLRPAAATAHFNNGSDGSLPFAWAVAVAPALERGYNCLTFYGPGEGLALVDQGLHFRPDWEQVITPVVDYALSRPEVDPSRVALMGDSQGGYWVPRAVAFEHRVAAAVADPGVWDVSTSWGLSKFPPPLPQLFASGNKTAFDQALGQGLASEPGAAATLAFRSRPFGFNSLFDTGHGGPAVRAHQRYRQPDYLPDAGGRSGRRAILARPVSTVVPGAARRKCWFLSRGRRAPTCTVSQRRPGCARSAFSIGWMPRSLEPFSRLAC